jgi:hypothetical protein
MKENPFGLVAGQGASHKIFLTAFYVRKLNLKFENVRKEKQKASISDKFALFAKTLWI